MTSAEKLIDAVGYLDDDLIEEAERVRFEAHPRKTYSKPMRFAALAACCAMLIFGAFLFPRFFINLGNKSSQEAAAPATAEQEEKATADTVMAGGVTEEAVDEAAAEEMLEEAKSDAEKTAEKTETTTAAVEETDEAEAPAENGQDSQSETATADGDSMPASAGNEYGALDLLLWSDTGATVTIDGVLYQVASQEDLTNGIRGTKVTQDLFDFDAPVGTVSETSDKTLVGAACYAATIDEVRYLLVEQPEGLYLFREIGH